MVITTHTLQPRLTNLFQQAFSSALGGKKLIAIGMVGSRGAAPIKIWVSASGKKNYATVFKAAREINVAVSANCRIPPGFPFLFFKIIIGVCLERCAHLFCTAFLLLCVGHSLTDDGLIIYLSYRWLDYLVGRFKGRNRTPL